MSQLPITGRWTSKSGKRAEFLVDTGQCGHRSSGQQCGDDPLGPPGRVIRRHFLLMPPEGLFTCDTGKRIWLQKSLLPQHPVLGFVEAAVDAGEGDEFVMTALLGNAGFVYHDDAVGVLDRC
jgi:hypothetical protein